MQVDDVPAALRERLGPEATVGLVEVLGRAYAGQRADMIAATTERFERRLVEEVGSVRVQLAAVQASLQQDMARTEAALRQDMTGTEAVLRHDMARMEAGLRQDMTTMDAGLRQAIVEMGAALRRETSEALGALRADVYKLDAGWRQQLAADRVELFKWSFIFWIGQVFAIAGIVGIMLRLYRP